MRRLEEKTFIVLVILSSIAAFFVVWPLASAILWALVLAIVFMPLNRYFLKYFNSRSGLSAFATIIVIIVIVILPLTAIVLALLTEAAELYNLIITEHIDFGLFFKEIINALPLWVKSALAHLGITDLITVQQKLVDAVKQGTQFAAVQILTMSQAVLQAGIGIGVMLYLLFFLLRDELFLNARLIKLLPLRLDRQNALIEKFSTVVRATVKGDILVAMIQGAQGGIIFWLLDIHAPILSSILMALLSLLPAIGAALLWLPVAIFLIASGEVIHGWILIGYGIFIIGLIDNIVRPVLVGKDGQMPNYVVLISTIGGLQMFGLNGFILGPVIAALCISIWGIFEISREKGGENNTPN